MATNPLLIEALNKSLGNLHATVSRLHFLTVSAPDDQQWDEVRDIVSCLDSIADVMRQAVEAIRADASQEATVRANLGQEY